MTLSLAFAVAFVVASIPVTAPSWGFYAHKKINRLAVFTLPAGMIDFYKAHIRYIEQASVNPDRRRYAVEDEGARHYLDVDRYGDSAFISLPRGWNEAVGKFGEDTLQTHGVLPWHLFTMSVRLREAFMLRDPARILKVSAELGHYVSDAHVPLHTTENYNGQLTGQDGIHGFWESRLPELFSEEYNLFVGPATYVRDPQQAIWETLESAHSMVGRVLEEERILAARVQEKKHSFETRGNTTVKVYAHEYARAYHRKLEGMVEKQMRSSIKMTGDLWYTAWIEAGQPDLRRLINYKPTEEELEQRREELRAWRALKLRGHE